MRKNRLQRIIIKLLVFLIQKPRILFYSLLSTNQVSGKPVCLQPTQALGAGQISIYENVSIGYYPSPFFFSTYAYIEARHPTSLVSIGKGTKINNNFCVIAEFTTVTIGRNCLIGTNVEVYDSNFHGISLEERRQSQKEFSRPVSLGDDVFIGSNVKIMKGVNIGTGSVIANGSIVTKNIPPNVIAGGNPARVIKAIN